MALDMTTFDSALKEHYTDDEVEHLTLSDHALMALLIKDEKVEGKQTPIPIVYGNNQRRSATFSSAQANTSTSLIEDFVITMASEYAFATIDGQTIDSSEGKSGAFMKAAATEFDGAFEEAANAVSRALYRNGTGSIGVAGTISTGTMYINPIQDVINFDIGMLIVESATDGSALGTGGTTGEVIAGVDHDLGTVTATSTNWTDVLAQLATGRYLYCIGDWNAKLKGLDAWVPSSAPGATAFFGVDRSVSPTRLGGCRYDGSSDPIEEALKQGAIRASKYGGKISHYFLTYERWGDLEAAMGSRVVYTKVDVTGEIGFQALVVNGPKGPIKVLPDAHCQQNTAWGLDMRYWKLYSVGKVLRILKRSGGDSQRVYNADSEEYRIGGYMQLGCRAPGRNVRVTVQT